VITDVSAVKPKMGETGITKPGIWYYRVSAVMAATDESNPGGETLASDVFIIDLSKSVVDAIVPTIYWSAVPNAAAYRIYRNPTGCSPTGVAAMQMGCTIPETVEAVRRIAEVPAPTTSFADTGVAASGPPPLPLGATGVWKPLPNLTTARDSLGVAAGQDPANPLQWHIYAMGGAGTGGGMAALDSVEHLRVTIVAAPDGSQNYDMAWSAGPNLSAGRSELTGYSVSNSEAVTVPPGQTYIYAGAGKGSRNVDASVIAAGGGLTWTPESTMAPNQAGYAGVPGAGFLFVFGGANAAPDDNIKAAHVSATPPTLDPGAWNNNGLKLLVPRYLAGGALESAFIYVVGGAGPLDSMERSVL
jgi:hypothetical protein